MQQLLRCAIWLAVTVIGIGRKQDIKSVVWLPFPLMFFTISSRQTTNCSPNTICSNKCLPCCCTATHWLERVADTISTNTATVSPHELNFAAAARLALVAAPIAADATVACTNIATATDTIVNSNHTTLCTAAAVRDGIGSSDRGYILGQSSRLDRIFTIWDTVENKNNFGPTSLMTTNLNFRLQILFCFDSL